MAAPANNPFGVAPQQASFANPFGTPAQNPFGAPAIATSNPFGAPANHFGAPVNNNLFGAAVTGSRPSSAGNPFGAPSGHTSLVGTPAGSPAPSRQPSPFQTAAGNGRSPSPFGSKAPPTGPASQFSGNKQADANAMARKNKFTGTKPAGQSNTGGFGGGQGEQSQGQQRATPFAKAFGKQPNGQPAAPNARFNSTAAQNKGPGRQPRSQQPPAGPGTQKFTPGGLPSERTKELSTFAYNYANKLCDHLKKENISPPQWLAQPGDPNKRGAVESLKDAYKKYRTRVYASLRKADLIDDPDKRRKLEHALPFKGTCEDMCPEFERCYRIAEFDVKSEEKETVPERSAWPDVTRMVKKFGRSAAGQDAPLPMDVRSVVALRRTTDYLFNDLLQSDSNLPAMHNFLWDRTRAVRKDFTFHSQKSAEEMKEMVYCFETITRFHATALHLLSRKGFANEDFDQRQEIEQLGRTILSLIEAYDVCRDKRVECENEAEFRAYYLLLNAHDPSIAKRVPTWGKEFWFESEEIQTALSLIQAMDDVREPKGPIKPRRPTTLSDTSFANYFAIVEDPRVSYTMACVAEIHFTTVRQAILRNLVRGYSRHRDAPRTITAADLNTLLRFDTPEEAVEFAELHGFEFTTWVPEGKNPVTEPYLLLNDKKRHVPSPRVRQAFSGKVVERKRTTQSLAHVIYNTIFEDTAERPVGMGSSSGEDGLFVAQSPASKELSLDRQPFVPASKPFAFPSATQSTFGTPTSSATPFANPVSSTSTGVLGSTPAPVFGGFPGLQSSQATATPNPFSPPSQPAAPAQPRTGPFSFLNQPSATPPGIAPKPASVLGQSGQTAAPPAAAKPTEAANPFGAFKGFTPTAAPSLAPAAQPSTAFPSAPSLLGTAKPTTAFTSAPAPAPAEAKPATAVPSLLGSASPAGVSPLSATPVVQPAVSQAPSTAAAVPSIFVSPTSITGPPAPPAQTALTAAWPVGQPLGQPPMPAQPPLPSSTGQTPMPGVTAPPAAPPVIPPPAPPPPPKRDLMGDVTKWFVSGDGGLMNEFTETVLHHMLWNIFQKFERDEEIRKKKEADAESWRIARQHLTHRLQVKYFYRWRNTARSLATKRILREGKEKMRLYREQQRAIQRQQQEEKEQAEREARRAAKRQLMEDGHRLTVLASSTRRRGSVAYSTDNNPEEQLLASGIFAGLRGDPRAVARRVAREADSAAVADSWALTSAPRSFRYPESELELEPAPTVSPRGGSPDTGSVGRREGWKTRSLRERFGIESRRSLSASGGSVVNGSVTSERFRQSLPGCGNTGRMTNFASPRKQGSPADGEEDEFGVKRAASAKPKSRHWDMRARGFVPMPDGNWLPEALARSTTANHNPPVEPDIDIDIDIPDTDAESARAPSPTPFDLRLRLARLRKSRPQGQGQGHTRARHSVDLPTAGWLDVSPGDMPPPPPPLYPNGRGFNNNNKRKRPGDPDHPHGEEEEMVDREISPSARKKANIEGSPPSVTGSPGVGGTGKAVVPGREETHAMVENTRRMLRELREAMERAEREERKERGVAA
ncbi:SAC3/GANP/Nin1/mts3/eIF-3 p25 family-domain-containing protein [Staphylotrichum tortipilum]|uniref:SAC3/GANP/Nin1/mts3/eIF-3 p25 family-domain-containing protein n=1 Tax=Staphylotrichum tortipilum TaxID=2831512 RepID=A0AAN6MDH8_9PEZI|nr:SAC3/GANP/Nin1/mts3/eIF-3 p25 family-domain-containing protein [Staphylotrichum longicolle]